MMRAPRRGRGFCGRLDGLGGYAGLGRWYVRRDRRKRRGCCRMEDCRWWLRAVRQEVGIQRDQAERKHCPDHQEVFQDQHHCPRAARAAAFPLSRATHLRGSFAAVWRYRNSLFSRLREEIGGGGLFLTRARTGAAASNPERATWQMKTRLRFLPAGPRCSLARLRRYIRGRKLGREQHPLHRPKS
jgi:hypothetical protein